MDEAAEACGLDPLEFRLRNYAETDPATGRPFSSKALRECYARGRRALRLGRPAARAAADARRRPACSSAGAWARALFPAPMFRGRGPRHAARRRHRAGRDLGRRHGPGRLDRARPDRRRRARPADRPRRVPRRPFRPSRRRRRRRLRPHRDRRQRALRRRQRRGRPARRARHRPPGLAALRRRQRRRRGARRPPPPPRRPEPQRELCRHPRARRPRASSRAAARGARDPADAAGAGDVLARRGLRRGDGRSRPRPGPGQPPRRRLRRRPDHQPAPRAQPAPRRHDLGRLLRAARGGAARPAHRPRR